MKRNDRTSQPFPPLRYRHPHPDSMNPQRPAAWDPSSPPKLQTIQARAHIIRGTLDKTLDALTLSGKAEVTSRPAMKTETRNKRLRAVRRPPGSALHDAAEFLLSKKILERIVQPAISEFQKEYFDALAEHRKVKAKWIRIRGAITLFKTLGLFSLANLLKEISRIAK